MPAEFVVSEMLEEVLNAQEDLNLASPKCSRARELHPAVGACICQSLTPLGS